MKAISINIYNIAMTISMLENTKKGIEIFSKKNKRAKMMSITEDKREIIIKQNRMIIDILNLV